jgi:hypothetical protein
LSRQADATSERGRLASRVERKVEITVLAGLLADKRIHTPAARDLTPTASGFESLEHLGEPPRRPPMEYVVVDETAIRGVELVQAGPG